MLSFFDHARVYIAREPVDMRKQVDGLALVVQEAFDLDPFTPVLFAFCNRQRDKVKVLFWHDNGFCLLYKCIEKGRFQWPRPEEPTLECSARDLKWLLEGLSLQDLPRSRRLYFKAV